MSKKILIIDDEPDLSALLSFRLEAHGFKVISALDGPTGLEKAKSDKPDLILLDLMMPGMDGFQAAKILKGDPETNEIPVIVFTAMASPELRQRVSEIRAFDYITKPFDPKDLLEKVKKALGGGDELRLGAGYTGS